MPSSLLVVYVNLFILRDSAMASITERAQRMEKELRETAAKHDRAAAELQVSLVHQRVFGVYVECVPTKASGVG